jgi:outer membrane immunogenic protein
MNKALVAAIGLVAVAGTPALAADLGRPYTKAPAMVAPINNWTGFYLGAMGGYASENAGALALKGGFGGGTIGYNWQASNWVFGIEADAAAASIRESFTASALVNSVLVTASESAKIDTLGTVRGRIGVAFDQVLLYGTGGYAWADLKVRGAATAGAVSVSVADSKVLSGWTVGAGVEWMFAPRWSLKGEYLFRSFGGETFFARSLPPGVRTGTLDINSGQVGVNYHF